VPATGLLRIGCVKYQNARPLIHGWPGAVVLDHPAALCRKLAAGELDVALVSSFEFLRNPIYLIVDDVSISSRGPVHSVFLAHAGPLAEIEEIELDPASQTSINLLRCLLAETGLTPRFVMASPENGGAVSSARARLLIGDQAIRFREKHGHDCEFWDLGEAWEQIARRPFVYALWLIRPDVRFAAGIADGLRACRDKNVAQLEMLAAAPAEFAPEFRLHYFRDCLHYHFGAPEKEGLLMFRKLCEKHAILSPSVSPLRVV
jgi:chorismate dehydratase